MRHTALIALAALAALLAGGCGAAPDAQEPQPTAPAPEATAAPAPAAPSPQPSPGAAAGLAWAGALPGFAQAEVLAAPYPADVAAAVDHAAADLAGRLGAERGAVAVEDVRQVVWPDSAAGCPRPGAPAKQVLTPGLLIRLRAGGAVFHYHRGKGGDPFLCTAKGPAAAP